MIPVVLFFIVLLFVVRAAIRSAAKPVPTAEQSRHTFGRVVFWFLMAVIGLAAIGAIGENARECERCDRVMNSLRYGR